MFPTSDNVTYHRPMGPQVPITTETLLLTRDNAAASVLQPCLRQMGTGVQYCTSSELAVEMLARWRFDAAVIDTETVPGADGVLRSLRSAPSNRSAIAFALVNRNLGVRDAFAMGATFVLEKPLSRDRARNTLRAAYGLMLYGRRRYYRHPVSIEGTFRAKGGQQHSVHIVNLSEGGAGVETFWLEASQAGRLAFELPGEERLMQLPTTVAWANKGSAGLQFLTGTPQLTELRAWIRTKFESGQFRGPDVV